MLNSKCYIDMTKDEFLRVCFLIKGGELRGFTWVATYSISSIRKDEVPHA